MNKLLLGLLGLLTMMSEPAFAQRAAVTPDTANVAPICRIIEAAARKYRLPVPFFTRLIWLESGFQVDVVSRAGAQGVAQFMPDTADQRGLLDPNDPHLALTKAAEYLADLSNRFGNIGLSAAAYNGGPARVAGWLDGHNELTAQTRAYVLTITGRPVEDWVEAKRQSQALPPVPASAASRSCLQEAQNLSRQGPPHRLPSTVPPFEARLAAYLEKALQKPPAVRQAGAAPGATQLAGRDSPMFCESVPTIGVRCIVNRR